jgi:hypothetical protein
MENRVRVSDRRFPELVMNAGARRYVANLILVVDLASTETRGFQQLTS